MKKDVALVLSCGGARGMAHIGVIEELERLGFKITSVAGSSIGSLVGGIYAAGNLNAYTAWMKELNRMDVIKLMDFAISKRGFIKGEKVLKEIKRFIGDQEIENLEIPYVAVASDFTNQKEVVFRKGSLLDAIRASVSIPTVFFPWEYEGAELVDGGLINPLPLDRVERSAGDLLVAVNLNSAIPYVRHEMKKTNRKIVDDFNHRIEVINKRWSKLFKPKSKRVKKTGFFNLLTGSFVMMQDKLAENAVEKNHPDIMVNISRHACDTLEFFKTEELIEAGRIAFREAYKNYSSTLERKH